MINNFGLLAQAAREAGLKGIYFDNENYGVHWADHPSGVAYPRKTLAEYQAQAVLGAMLFKGEYTPRQAARGLMWLTLARDGASSQETWIADLYAAALKQATDEERAAALGYLERWLKGHRE